MMCCRMSIVLDEKSVNISTPLFLSSFTTQVAYLERLRSDLLKRSCIMIQKNVKCWLIYKRFQRMRRSAIVIQCWIRVRQAKRWVLLSSKVVWKLSHLFSFLFIHGLSLWSSWWSTCKLLCLSDYNFHSLTFVTWLIETVFEKSCYYY